MIVTELVAVLGAKVEKGDFADVFAMLDKVQDAALKVAGAVDQAIRKGFEIVNRVAMAGDETATAAEKMGIATSALQELSYAAILSDTSAESLATGLKFLGKNAAEAAEKGGEAAKAFAGIKLKENGKIRNLDDLLADVADKFTTLPDAATKTARAMEIFGRSGVDLIPMLNRGSAGIGALRAEALAMGYVLDNQGIKSSEAYDDSLKRLEATFKGLENQFAGPIIGKVTELFEKLRKTLSTKGMARAVEILSKGFGRLVDTLGLFVDVLGWLTSNDTVVSGAIYVITSAMIGLAAWAATAGAAMTVAAVSAAASWALAALPFLALGALIFLIADELYTFAEGGDTLLGDLIGWFDKVDPEDSPFLKLLRTAGSLLFDLTDPAKWMKLGQALSDYLLSPVTALVDGLKWILNKMGVDTSKFDFSVNSKLSNVAPAIFGEGGGIAKAFPGLADPFNSGSQSTGEALASKFPGAVDLYNKLDGWNMEAGNFVAQNLAPAAVRGNSTTISAPIAVTVGPGVDPEAVGEAVRKVVREELGNELSNASAANGG